MSVWTSKTPEKDGWYWIKYRGKHGITVCPCRVTWIDDECVAHSARNDTFITPKQFKGVKFGPGIVPPGR